MWGCQPTILEHNTSASRLQGSAAKLPSHSLQLRAYYKLSYCPPSSVCFSADYGAWHLSPVFPDRRNLVDLPSSACLSVMIQWGYSSQLRAATNSSMIYSSARDLSLWSLSFSSFIAHPPRFHFPTRCSSTGR